MTLSDDREYLQILMEVTFKIQPWTVLCLDKTECGTCQINFNKSPELSDLLENQKISDEVMHDIEVKPWH